VLFSQLDVAALMNEGFECAWQSVRAVPRATIDFGDGRVLERTLNGNVATWITTSDGRALDLLPGLVDAEEYLRALGAALALHAEVAATPPGEAAALVSARHAERLGALPALVTELRQRAEMEKLLADLAKSRVERPLKHGLLQDTLFNAEHRYALASQMLAERPLAPAADLTRDAYRTILGVDLDDPFLGLAPYVVGGDVGRHADG
jgi:hypothetical protein